MPTTLRPRLLSYRESNSILSYRASRRSAAVPRFRGSEVGDGEGVRVGAVPRRLGGRAVTDVRDHGDLPALERYSRRWRTGTKPRDRSRPWPPPAVRGFRVRAGGFRRWR
ncbi:hypothetical protein GCM10010363_72070 [Streptomyces omiyaensis]|nr:hypothetical protein GCM10010363_72070 [Streptomyces omiyaensis]